MVNATSKPAWVGPSETISVDRMAKLGLCAGRNIFFTASSTGTASRASVVVTVLATADLFCGACWRI